MNYLPRTWRQSRLIINERTAAEIAAGVTPVDYGYEPGDVRRYGAVGDGATDDTVAIQNALEANAGSRIYLRSLVLKTINEITIDSSIAPVRVIGEGGKIRKFHTGNGISVTNGADEVGFKDVLIEGAVESNVTYAQGAGVAFSGTTRNCYMSKGGTNDIDIGLQFGSQAGGRFKGTDLLLEPYTKTSGSEGRLIYLTAADTSATQRAFVDCFGQGVIETNGMNDASFLGCKFRRIVTHDDDSVLFFLACTIANSGQTVTLKSGATAIIGCRFAGDVVIDTMFSGSFIGNIQTAGTFTNNISASGNALVHHHPLSTNYDLLNQHKMMIGSTTGSLIKTTRRVSPGNADSTFSPVDGRSHISYGSPITADRTVVLTTTDAELNIGGRVTRKASATGAFVVNVGTGLLIALAVNQWCDFEYNGSAYEITGFGSLS